MGRGKARAVGGAGTSPVDTCPRVAGRCRPSAPLPPPVGLEGGAPSRCSLAQFAYTRPKPVSHALVCLYRVCLTGRDRVTVAVNPHFGDSLSSPVLLVAGVRVMKESMSRLLILFF